MKYIISTAATVALQVSADDVVPLHGLMSRDLIEAVAEAYQFAVKPQIPPGVPPFAISMHQFQSGMLVVGDQKFPILQLVIVPNGDIVTASTTEVADTILDNFMALLDRTFAYRFASAKQTRVYQSNIVVQFESGIAEKIDGLLKIENILTHEIVRPSMPFKIKRLAFGYGDPAAPQLSFESLESSDFTLERRAGEPYSENRYFSSAPTKTTDHVRILELIEAELAK